MQEDLDFCIAATESRFALVFYSLLVDVSL